MVKKYVWLLVVCLNVSGCFWSSHRPQPNSNPVKTLSVEILRPDLLAGGGAVLVEPFKAGPEAEATPTLDRIALSIVKGAADALSQSGGRLVYKSTDSPGEAGFIIEGHIDKFKSPSTMDRILLKKETLILVKGDIRDIKSREIVALIYDQRKTVNNLQALQTTAYGIGVDIVRELVK